jgi:excisionase family DNA binding protein
MTLIERKAYRIAEVADILGLSKGTVRGLIAQGQIRSVKVGRSVLILAGDLDAYVERLRKGR